MECPKCQGASYLSEEEFIQLLDSMEPVRVITKGVYVCKICADKFTRIHIEDVEGKRRPAETAQAGQPGVSKPARAERSDIPETLKFF